MTQEQAQRFQSHAVARIDKRLAHLVREQDLEKIAEAARRYRMTTAKIYFVVRRFDQVVHIDEDIDGSGDGINGDAIVAIIKRGKVITIMLTKSWRDHYFSDGILTGEGILKQ